MITHRVSRRQFLVGVGVGAGGFTLGLPLLPSILEREARAGTPPAVPKNFVAFWSGHGGIAGKNMYPADPASPTTATYPLLGHTIRASPLALQPAPQGSTTASVSPVVSGDATKLTAQLVAKMNVIRGLDTGTPLGHNMCGALGNYGGTFTGTNGVDNVEIPTIDQIMAYSPSFYPDLGAIKERYINFGSSSRTWKNPATRSGGIQTSNPDPDNLTWFNKIFSPAATGPTPKPVVDQVLADYKRLRNGNRRLSTADRARLDAHMQYIAELQHRLNVHATCGNVTPPKTGVSTVLSNPKFGTDASLQSQAFALANDVIVAAMICGTCRIGNQSFQYVGDSIIHGDDSANYNLGPSAQGSNDWHHGIAHGHYFNVPQSVIAHDNQMNFTVMLDLISKMDQALVTPDSTLLDNSLVFWSMECGAYTHDSTSLPVVMAGSAGGALKTGMYLDYRNMFAMNQSGVGTEVGDKTHYGIPYNQWMGTCLQAMGLSRSEYETPGVGGYGQVANDGYQATGDKQNSAFDKSVYTVTGDYLPFIRGPKA